MSDTAPRNFEELERILSRLGFHQRAYIGAAAFNFFDAAGGHIAANNIQELAYYASVEESRQQKQIEDGWAKGKI